MDPSRIILITLLQALSCGVEGQETGLCSLMSGLCVNGGTCIQQGTDSENSNVACLCTPRFTGLRCEVASPTILPTTMRMATSTGTLPSTVEDMMTDPSRDNITDGVTARETSPEMAQTSTSMETGLCSLISELCFNGGTCIQQGTDSENSNVACLCTPRFTGLRCEVASPTTLPTTMRMATSTGTLPSTVEDMMTDPSRDNITDGVTARETSTEMAQTSTSMGTRPSTVEDMITDASTDVITDGVTARETASVTAQTFISSGTAPSTIEDMMIDAATDVITDLVTARETSFVTAQSPTPSGTGTFTAEDATTRAVTNMTTNRSVIQDTSAVIAETSSLSGTLIFTERRRTDVSIALISSVANLRAERCIFCQEIDDNGECIDDDGFTTCDILEDEICISVNVTFTIKGSKNRQVSRGCIAKVFFGVTSSRCISVEEYTTALGFDPVEEPSSGEACFCDEEDLCNTHSLSGILADKVMAHLDEQNILVDEQKGARGTKDQLIIDKTVFKDSRTRRTNLTVAWIDYQKAYDSVPHSWIIEAMRMHKLDPKICTLIEQTMPYWTTDLTANGQHLGRIPIRCGIFQGDALSPLLFRVAHNPLGHILKNSRCSYKLKSGLTTHHLLYMDDLKLYGKNEREIDSMINTVRIFGNDIGMKLGLEKCGRLIIKRGKVEATQGLLLDIGRIQDVEVHKGYKYVGILQGMENLQEKVKANTIKTHRKRIRQVLKTKLTGQNKIQALNTYAMPVISFTAGIIEWTRTEMADLDRRTRKLLNIYRGLHPRADVHRLYLPRHQGGRGLKEVEATTTGEKVGLDKYIERRRATEPLLLQAVWQARPQQQEGETRDQWKAGWSQRYQSKWKERPLYGQYPQQVEQATNTETAYKWLSCTGLKIETEALITAAQNQALCTKYHQAKILKQSDDSKCRMYREADETRPHTKTFARPPRVRVGPRGPKQQQQQLLTATLHRLERYTASIEQYKINRMFVTHPGRVFSQLRNNTDNKMPKIPDKEQTFSFWKGIWETIILRLAPNVPGGSVTIEWFIIGEGLDFEGFYVEVQTEESEQWVRLSSFLGADVRNFTVESLENVTGIRIVAIDQSKSEVARSIQVPIRSVESGTYENMDRNVSELILVPAASLLVFVAFAAIVLKLRKANLLKETPR
ncbi:Retrovirus-related Pol polyprotein from type-2 retrotransposable element R2DM [Holothuria leucospilota]|uniref:Retrovirus-related Pol polyprotein from type-2 retrotransposable element R2DM n=1 Tax=Holothuria leucospilota TaxID=206669 RepID=A0A9Q1C7I1_HOLLE|nr:Retrovirus-related Pol polyprotein from type-2 retrotransposable element R2DM [Holothuria leucospilota]